MSECQEEMKQSGGAYPRTCPTCGLGPCTRHRVIENPADDEKVHNLQYALYPNILQELVKRCKYRPGWRVFLEDIDRGQGSRGLTLVIQTLGYDSYNPQNGESYRVNHYMPVPPAAFNERSWRRWLFEQFLLVERHEAAEFFRIDGKRPYAPLHGPGNDPYIIHERSTDEEVRTMYTGEVLRK